MEIRPKEKVSTLVYVNKVTRIKLKEIRIFLQEFSIVEINLLRIYNILLVQYISFFYRYINLAMDEYENRPCKYQTKQTVIKC